MDLIRNCNHYKNSHQSKLQLIAASIRNQKHLDECYECGVDIITVPKQLILDYCENLDKEEQPKIEDKTTLQAIPKAHSYTKNWQEIDIYHPLTEKGLNRFIADWQAVME
jgi:transaldolase